MNGEAARAFRQSLNVSENPTCQRCVCSLNYHDKELVLKSVPSEDYAKQRFLKLLLPHDDGALPLESSHCTRSGRRSAAWNQGSQPSPCPSQDGTPSVFRIIGVNGLFFISIRKTNPADARSRRIPIRTDLPKFEAHNAVVLGVSLDTAESHKSFCAQDGLTFKLLADPERQAAAAYGVPLMTFKDMKFDERDTFLIAPDGKIAQVWRKVDPRKDSTIVLAGHRNAHQPLKHA